jgi:hypothetical protein
MSFRTPGGWAWNSRISAGWMLAVDAAVDFPDGETVSSGSGLVVFSGGVEEGFFFGPALSVAAGFFRDFVCAATGETTVSASTHAMH